MDEERPPESSQTVQISSRIPRNNGLGVHYQNPDELHSDITEIQQKVITFSNNPPDGGTRAWLVMISSFLCLGLIFGLINSYSVIYSYLQRNFAGDGPEASSKAALIGSITFGTTLFCSPIAGMMADKIGMPFTTLLGAVFCVMGLMLSSLDPRNVTVLLLTYGFVFGLGASLVYTPTLSILGIYFKRYLGKVNGFVCSGASIFTVIMPPTLAYILNEYNLTKMLHVLAGCFCFLIVAAFVYQPMRCPKPQEVERRSYSTFNMDIWKERPYIIWVLSSVLALSGYYVSYVHMAKFVEVNFPKKNTSLPIMCIGAASCIGRLIIGVVSDIPGVNRIRLQQCSMIGIGVITAMLPAIKSYDILIFSSLVMGIFDGMFFPVLGPIAYQLCGPDGASQGIGCFLGLVAVPLSVGPVLAGKIYDETGSYTVPFIIAGIPSILGALCMGFIKPEHDEIDQKPASSSNLLNEKSISTRIVIDTSQPTKNEDTSATIVKRRYKYSIF